MDTQNDCPNGSHCIDGRHSFEAAMQGDSGLVCGGMLQGRRSYPGEKIFVRVEQFRICAQLRD